MANTYVIIDGLTTGMAIEMAKKHKVKKRSSWISVMKMMSTGLKMNDIAKSLS